MLFFNLKMLSADKDNNLYHPSVKGAHAQCFSLWVPVIKLEYHEKIIYFSNSIQTAYNMH